MPLSPADDSFSSTSWTTPGAGITGGYDGDSETLRIFIVFCAGLGIYNACELITMIFLTFNEYHGLYFWSLLCSSAGIIPHAVGFLLKFMNLTSGKARWLDIVLITIGWYPMVTGESLVLWSRLYLIVSGDHGERILRYTKWMIVVDAVILHIPTTVLTFGSNGHDEVTMFAAAYSVMEKIQMAGFFIQEVTLSSIYIVETIRILKTSLRPRTRKTMQQLIAINAVIILMDLVLLGLESASLYILEAMLKAVVYSIKLKLEFAILSKLVNFVGQPQSDVSSDPRKPSIPGFVITDRKTSMIDGEMELSEFVDLSRVRTDLTHPSRETSNTSRRRGSKASGWDETQMARFQHVEGISTLAEDSCTPSSRSPSRDRERVGDEAV